MQRWKDGIVTAGGAPVWAEGGYVTSSLRGTGLKDSMMDMLVNIIGAAVVCGVALIGLKLRPDWFEGKRLMLSLIHICSGKQKRTGIGKTAEKDERLLFRRFSAFI